MKNQIVSEAGCWLCEHPGKKPTFLCQKNGLAHVTCGVCGATWKVQYSVEDKRKVAVRIQVIEETN